ncbi:aminotransferase class I/II-fold pyridoxal phosphate-dependent enzyme, partial [Parvimonas micra]
NELNKIEELRVVPSQANYFTIELKKGNSKELCSKMLENYNIFIKDLTSKINLKNREFIRVAVRNIEDNEIFVSAVKDYFKNI